MMMRWLEFFEGDDSRLSMTRLMMFLAFFPASYVVVLMQTEGSLAWYLSAYALGYVGGKMSDVMGRPRHATRTTTVINQPEKVVTNVASA